MSLLLDTCTFLWFIKGDGRLPSAVAQQISDSEMPVFLSSISAYEISVKYRLGRLPFPLPPDIYVPTNRIRHGIEELPFDEVAALHVMKLPPVHKDPFDRMLIGQAVAEGLVLVTPDPVIRMYPVRVLWEV